MFLLPRPAVLPEGKILKENQRVGCEGEWTHAHVRRAFACVRVKRLLKQVSACGHFWAGHTPHTCDRTFGPPS